MKTINKKTIIIAAATLFVGFLAGWLIFGLDKSSSPETQQQDETEIAKETVWTCSMHPQIRQEEPGDCPICGMDLIPLDNEQNEDIDPRAISMSPTAMQLADIRTAVVEKTEAVKQIRLNGKVQADERLVYSQSLHIPGRIEKLLVNFTGEYVRKGQTIAQVYSPELITAQEELLEARKISETQPQLFAAAKEKLKNWKLSDKQIEEILISGEIQEEFPVQADVSGYLTEKMVKPGDYIREGEAIYEITDLSKVWVLFDVYESDIVWVKRDDKLRFSVASQPGENYEGKISYIDPVIDPKTRVAKARLEYKNPNGNLKPEMFVSGVVEAKLSGKPNSLVVPKTAVMWTGKRSVVYIKTTSEQSVTFIMREITLGPALGDSYVVEQGLQEGEEIAVNGTFSIDAAAQLAGKPSMMSPEGGQAMTGHNHGSPVTVESASGSQPEEKQKSTASLSIDKNARDALQPLYRAYLQWKEALSNDDFNKAKQSAASMKTALDKIDMGMFTGDAHNAWMDYQETLNEGLQHVLYHLNIEKLRKSFQTVSATMIDMTDAFDPLDETIYVQHCPMADNNKGADWLSSEKEIKNPYFGSSMLTCGEVTKEIK
ncbi:MAG: efflux RND transporter periplasmic adaptor subunit [Bacteroidales bacterium]|jgi:Cu(I)/Ag(I) efflux system membrane fusion protein|nr:efflux RND transporter periplasmic adaptor subunit [Bacteroidales bacterium]